MKSRKEAVVEDLPPKKFPLRAEDYKLYEEVGRGVSAAVHRALCIPLNEIVAIKVMDLERCGTDLDTIRREVHTMTLLNHPHLLRAHCSFVSGTNLWIVTPYMDSGSALHIMKFVHPTGFNQSIIATMLHSVIKALVYLHSEGLIHRDIKAGNILVDSKGLVKLADFGVSASLFDGGDRRHARNTFVGTPCWMAPEVMQQLDGYDFKADIWSFGITALELAHGHAPFSNYPPMKVLLMTIQNAPPGLDYERDKQFSKSFKSLISNCLVKDPKRRPTALKLLRHRFFRYAESQEYVAQTILQGLPPLGDRYRTLKENEARLLARNKEVLDDEEKENKSQKEYIRGISAWDFDPNDLKIQAALLEDSDEDGSAPTIEKEDANIERKVDSSAAAQEKFDEKTNPSDLNNSTKSAKLIEFNNLQNPDGSSKSYPNGSVKKIYTPNGGDLRHPGTKEENRAEVVAVLPVVQPFEKPKSVPKEIPNGSIGECSRKPTNPTFDTNDSILTFLQYLLKQNSMQKEQIMKCFKYVQEASESPSNNERVQMFEAHCREQALESHVQSLTQCNELLLKDLETVKIESAKLEKKLEALKNKK